MHYIKLFPLTIDLKVFLWIFIVFDMALMDSSMLNKKALVHLPFFGTLLDIYNCCYFVFCIRFHVQKDQKRFLIEENHPRTLIGKVLC